MNNLLVLLLAALPASWLAQTASVAGQARAGIARDIQTWARVVKAGRIKMN